MSPTPRNLSNPPNQLFLLSEAFHNLSLLKPLCSSRGREWLRGLAAISIQAEFAQRLSCDDTINNSAAVCLFRASTMCWKTAVRSDQFMQSLWLSCFSYLLTSSFLWLILLRNVEFFVNCSGFFFLYFLLLWCNTQYGPTVCDLCLVCLVIFLPVMGQFIIIHSFISPHCLSSMQFCRGLEPIPAVNGQEVGYKQPPTLTFTPPGIFTN